MSGRTIDAREAEQPSIRRDRRAERREATVAEIVDAAWDLVHERGLSELSLRDLGDRVGMRAQSLYSYFDSKHAIYDAMFEGANEALLERMRAVDESDGTAEERFRRAAHELVDFALQDAERSQLLFQRTIPGFEPSAHAYAPAVEVLDLARKRLADLGITRLELLDMWTAMLSGLIMQQLANEPGGNRWRKLVDDAVTMYLQFARGGSATPSRRQPRTRRQARKGAKR